MNRYEWRIGRHKKDRAHAVIGKTHWGDWLTLCGETKGNSDPIDPPEGAYLLTPIVGPYCAHCIRKAQQEEANLETL